MGTSSKVRRLVKMLIAHAAAFPTPSREESGSEYARSWRILNTTTSLIRVDRSTRRQTTTRFKSDTKDRVENLQHQGSDSQCSIGETISPSKSAMIYKPTILADVRTIESLTKEMYQPGDYRVLAAAMSAREW
jgi:hypothetical protein